MGARAVAWTHGNVCDIRAVTSDALIVDGVRLETAWLGPPPSEAPTLVFLHEGLGSVSLWRDFPRALGRSTGLSALVYGRRGYGASDARPAPWPVGFMHDEATVLGRVLDGTDIRDAILVGHSDGASIALIRAGRDRDPRIRALVLEAPHVFVEGVSVASIARIREQYATTNLRARLARHHVHVDDVFSGWNDVWLSPAFRAWNIETELSAVTCPALVLQGADDEYGTAAQVTAVQQGLAGPVTSAIIQNCGHGPHRDQASVVLDSTVRLLSEIPA
jgi:pimeloyl-ACP methyl ester carboxylesterase